MIRPLGDRVLIKPDKNPEQTDSGLWLSEHAKPETQGVIVAIGKACKWPSVAVGNSVVFSWVSGQDIIMDDEHYILMREVDLLAVFEGEHV